PPPARIHPAAMEHLRSLMLRFYDSLSDRDRYRLNRYTTFGIGLFVEEEDENNPRLRFAMPRNRISRRIRTVAEGLGMTESKPRARAEGRGAAVGAPEDAEQLLMADADATGSRLVGAIVNRRICPDCAEAIADVNQNEYPIDVEVVRDPVFLPGGRLNTADGSMHPS